jgi:hypothetical protein
MNNDPVEISSDEKEVAVNVPVISKEMLAPMLRAFMGPGFYPGRYQHRNQSEATLEKAQAKRNRKARKRLENLR